MQLGRMGVWFPMDRLAAPGELAEFAQRIEALGYSTLWYPEAVGYESFSLASFLLTQTQTLRIGSSIANIYARDAVTARNGLKTLTDISGHRFILGLGVSHPNMVEGLRGHRYGRPVATMRAYLDAIAAGEGVPDPQEAVVIAALGPKMLALAATKTAGAIPYLVTPEHTVRAREILGPGKLLAVEQKVWLGFTEDDFENSGSNRLVDAVIAWGSQADIERRLHEHFEAGADHVCIQPVHRDNEPGPDWDALKAFVP
jgi:probable F420-dependent oxidoreductase